MSNTYLSLSAVRQKSFSCSVSVSITLLSADEKLPLSMPPGEGGRSVPGRIVASSSLVLLFRFRSLSCEGVWSNRWLPHLHVHPNPPHLSLEFIHLDEQLTALLALGLEQALELVFLSPE